MTQRITLLFILFTSLSGAACVNATEGQYKVQVIKGQINRVIKPSDQWVNTFGTVGDEYYDVNIRSFTEKIAVKGSTKDNAAVTMEIAVTASPLADDESIKAYVRKFGLDEEERNKRMLPILSGQVNTEGKNAINEHTAYGLLANQEKIQKRVLDTLKPIFKDQLYQTLESVQIIGRPDFDDDRIEQAASEVVANQKKKEASEAALAAAQVDAQRKQVEAQTFANPALFQLEVLKQRLEIERARADGIKHHQGPLTIVNGTQDNMQLQLKGGQ